MFVAALGFLGICLVLFGIEKAYAEWPERYVYSVEAVAIFATAVFPGLLLLTASVVVTHLSAIVDLLEKMTSSDPHKLTSGQPTARVEPSAVDAEEDDPTSAPIALMKFLGLIIFVCYFGYVLLIFFAAGIWDWGLSYIMSTLRHRP